MKYGFATVAAAVPRVKVADTHYNILAIEEQIAIANSRGVELIVFPELSITGYSCQDLFHSQLLLEKAEDALMHLLDFSRKLDIISVVGMPVAVGDILLNCAVVVQQGVIIGIVPKTFLPNYGEFYEKRWFCSALDIHSQTIYIAGNPITITPEPKVFTTYDGLKFGIEICEDLWSPLPPSNNLTLAGADIIVNLSASDELIGKHQYLRQLISQQSARTLSAYVYSSCGFGESTQDVVYGGNAIIAENGRMLFESERFCKEPQLGIAQIDIDRLRSERRSNTTFTLAQRTASAVDIKTRQPEEMTEFRLVRDIDPTPFIPKSDDMKHSCEEILNIQTSGLAKRLDHTGCKHVVVGISGGLDSTLALLVCVRTFDYLSLDRKGIHGITMPGFGTTDRTHLNAVNLMESLGVTVHEISIAKSVTQHFEDIGHDSAKHDVTYENSQARERTQILMDMANRVGGLVVGTGDLSELALGWATYNGDHMSMYGVNASIPKTLIRHLVRYVADNDVDAQSRLTLLDIIDTPISPELIPADENGNISQKTEDLVGPYELHDFFLYHYLRFGYRPAKLFLMATVAFDGHDPSVSAYDHDTIKHWLKTFFRRFFAQQFKRSCLPDGPKVGSVSLSPRGDWRMPSDASCCLWLEEIDSLK
ncbi:NAD(+) synthase [Prevotella sp. P2-180]|uniref:NAD(+) synthase n=1 Tax=Prevotella sp. P2-180 TaxID=2024224 RepID=UPI000B978835|nr:NAD(+) synthase [Prevotella sp. P2-180]OYP66712.1 NAD(+) synthase [Prevotella sp. P2-180]